MFKSSKLRSYNLFFVVVVIIFNADRGKVRTVAI